MILVNKEQIRALMSNRELPRIKRVSLKAYIYGVNYGNAESAMIPAEYGDYL